MLPNFLIVGSAKAGTTSLYYYLQQHPEISFPELKEPKYFSSINLTFPHQGIGDATVDKFAIKDFENYQEFFSNIENKRVGEASPDYLFFHEETPLEIKKRLGDIPIIIILRDPVKRAFSAYSYLARDSRELLSFREALDKENERYENNYDFIWSYKHGGLYYEQVKSYMDHFLNVKVLLLEDLISNPDDTIMSLFDFLEVDPNFKINMSVAHNPSGRPSNFFAKFLLSRDNKTSQIIRELLKKYINRDLLENIAAKFLVREKLNLDDEQYLRDYFYKDIVKLEKLTNIDLSIWKKES